MYQCVGLKFNGIKLTPHRYCKDARFIHSSIDIPSPKHLRKKHETKNSPGSCTTRDLKWTDKKQSLKTFKRRLCMLDIKKRKEVTIKRNSQLPCIVNKRTTCDLCNTIYLRRRPRRLQEKKEKKKEKRETVKTRNADRNLLYQSEPQPHCLIIFPNLQLLEPRIRIIINLTSSYPG